MNKKLEEALKTAVDTNKRQRYMAVLSLWFVKDDTNAVVDLNDFGTAFQNHFDAMKVDYKMTEHHDIRSFLLTTFDSMLPLDFGKGEECSILVVHYAGHATLNFSRAQHDPVLILQPLPRSSKRETLPFDLLQINMMEWAESRPQTQILIVLECCHAGASVSRACDNTVELIYAAKSTCMTSTRGQGMLSFTQKFLGAINQIRAADCHKACIDPVEVLGILTEQGTLRSGGHKVVQGGERLSLYFRDTHDGNTATSGLPLSKVLLQLEMPQDPRSPAAVRVLKVLRNLSTTVAAIDILAIDSSGSVTITFRCSAVWGLRLPTHISKMATVKFLCWSFASYNLDSLLQSEGGAVEDQQLVDAKLSDSELSEETSLLRSTPPTSPMLQADNEQKCEAEFTNI